MTSSIRSSPGSSATVDGDGWEPSRPLLQRASSSGKGAMWSLVKDALWSTKQPVDDEPTDDAPTHRCSVDTIASTASGEGGALRSPGRRRSVGSLDCVKIRPELIRGMRLSRLLGIVGGLLWTKSPLDMPMGTRAKLWDLSEQCEEIDKFISHAWVSPGWQKYLGLLVKFYWGVATSIGCCLAALLILLDVFGQLPTMQAKCMQVDLSVEVSAWAWFPSVVSMLVIFILPGLLGREMRTNVFLDSTCIHQVDPGLKEEGIYSLHAFLARSKELMVLWTPEYLSRLWCVFELVCFTSLTSATAIEWCPLFKYCSFFMLNASLVLTVIMQVALDGEKVDPKYKMVSLVVFQVVDTMAMYYLVTGLRRYMRTKKEVISQLENFEVDKAGCRDEEDRDFIKRSIELFHGSEATFEAYVQVTLRNQAVESVPGAFRVTWLDCLGISWPRLCYCAQCVVAFAKADLPRSECACLCLGVVTQELIAFPAFMAIMYLITEYFSAERGSKAGEIALNCFLTLFLEVLAPLMGVPPGDPSWEMYVGYLVVMLACTFWIFAGDCARRAKPAELASPSEVADDKGGVRTPSPAPRLGA